MRKQLLCLMMVAAAGCADQPASAPTASAPGATASVDGNAVILAKFTCPGMT